MIIIFRPSLGNTSIPDKDADIFIKAAIDFRADLTLDLHGLVYTSALLSGIPPVPGE